MVATVDLSVVAMVGVGGVVVIVVVVVVVVVVDDGGGDGDDVDVDADAVAGAIVILGDTVLGGVVVRVRYPVAPHLPPGRPRIRGSWLGGLSVECWLVG